MQELLDNNDTLMYSTHNEGKSVIAERFIKTLKAKIYKKMAANDGKSYLPYLNKLLDQYKNNYHHSVNQKPINAEKSALTKKIETKSNAPKFKVNNRVRFTNYNNIFSKVSMENWSRDVFVINSVLKTNPWKDLNGEKVIGNFYEKELLWSIL